MTHYYMKVEKEKRNAIRKERWETLAAFFTFASLVALAGATYGSLLRDDVYAEVQDHHDLSRFAGMLESSDALEKELSDEGRHFTIIAPTDYAFSHQTLTFRSDAGDIDDKRVVQSEGRDYILQGEGYVVRSQVMPQDIPVNDTLLLPTANGETVELTRRQIGGEGRLYINGSAVRERIIADNGIIYIVDDLIHPVPRITDSDVAASTK